MKPTLPKMSFFLQRIALIIFSFLPVGLAIYYQLLYLSHQLDYFLTCSDWITCSSIFLPLIVFLIQDDVWHSIEEMGYVPLWVIILPLPYAYRPPLLSTNFSSDMADIHAFAVDVASGQPFANLHNYQGIPRASHLNMTGLVMSVLYRIVGASFATPKTLMVVLVALTVWLIYLAGNQLAASAGRVYCSQHLCAPSIPGLLREFYQENIFRSSDGFSYFCCMGVSKSEKNNLVIPSSDMPFAA